METMVKTELDSAALKFKVRLESVFGKVILAENFSQAIANIAEIINSKIDGSIVVPSSLYPQLQPIFGDKLQAATSTGQIAQGIAGISYGEFGICETGSVVFAVNDPLEREVAMLSPVHFALLYEDTLVPNLEAAGQKIRQLQTQQNRRYVSFVTGPSRTADVERVLTVGVQGPKEFYAVLIAHRETEQEVSQNGN